MAEADEDVTMDDIDVPDDEGQTQQGQSHYIDEDLDEKYPNRPHNHSVTLPFHDLYLTLFNPLIENKKKPTGPVMARKKQGPHGPTTLSPNEMRRNIIERFVSRWRKEVGDDIYPAFRLIVPEKDRDRAMYGLKEKTIGKLLVRVMQIDKNSEDGFNLLNWKLPGLKSSSAMAGDFAGRCYEVIKKRPIRVKPGGLTIAEVNERLDKLSIAQKEDPQLVIFQEFYREMCPEELLWLIRIILRQMKVGATERTIFDVWHPEAENLFNVCSSLRRVCWELSDPNIRLDSDERGIGLMQCFVPQLAAFQMHSVEKMVARMNPTEEDPVFWIEEKLDGERMQLHMMADDTVRGGMRFRFWSRKAKDYTYLYGDGFDDQDSALTRHIKTAFHENVRNIILDGEMITWDPEEKAIVPFGTLKTAALSEQKNPFSTGHRPVFKIFDCLYLNDRVLTGYTLRDRRKALQSSVKTIQDRFEIHTYTEGHSAADVEPKLRKVIEEASEGLVLKNPRSMYRLNDRNDDWMKVKPEYMTEFGEALDCVVIGGYYGSGKRGGRLSSFLCGLRVDQTQIDQGANPLKCFSFFKVGGGMAASDYADIRHRTDGKWRDWDARRPPTEFIELGGGDRQYERPDVWIRPDESIVVSVKAAQVTTTDQFRMLLTLRFPRFKKLRTDKDWRSALSIQEFIDLKARAEAEKEEKQFKVDDARRQRKPSKRKKTITVAGQDDQSIAAFSGPQTKLFDGISFYILTESSKPKKTKAEIEQLVKANGGTVVQTERADKTICIADRNVVKAASIKKMGKKNLIKSSWLFDCIEQAEIDKDRPSLLLPLEPNHIFHAKEDDLGKFEANVDGLGDSYVRDVTVEELERLLESIPKLEDPTDSDEVMEQLFTDHDIMSVRGWMFRGVVACIIGHDDLGRDGDLKSDSDRPSPIMDTSLLAASRTVDFAGGRTVWSMDADGITHVIVSKDCRHLRDVRQQIAKLSRLPRLVNVSWIEDCWKEQTLLDEELYFPR